MKLALTTTDNSDGNAKSKRIHSSFVKALMKACNGKVSNLPRLLPFELSIDRIIHSTIMKYMLGESMFGQKLVMPIEKAIPTWSVLLWEDGFSKEELFSLRI